jgi:DUF4097 and DUF4098 domain-containing protein YvlB
MNAGNLKIVTMLLALAPMSLLAGESVNEQWDVDADASISIENIVGEIIIEGWNKNEARLTGELGDSVEELEVSASSSSLNISVLNKDHRNIDGSDLKLMIPHGASIEASAVSADIAITDLDNEKLIASSVSGDVEVEATSQRVSIESVSGDVEFSGETARISAESVSGDLELSGISGDFSATTVSGDMELQVGMIDNGKLETVSGNIAVVGQVSNNGKLRAESMSGDVEVILPSSQSGTFKAQSFSGLITTAFGTVKNEKHGPGSHLKHVAGDGGGDIRVESFSGNIKLKYD